MASLIATWPNLVMIQHICAFQIMLVVVNGHFVPNGPNDCPPGIPSSPGMPYPPSYAVQQFVSMGPSASPYPPSMMGGPSQPMQSPYQQQPQQHDLSRPSPMGQVGRQVHQFVLESGSAGTTMTVANGVVIRGDQAATTASNVVMMSNSMMSGNTGSNSNSGTSSSLPGMSSSSYLNTPSSNTNRGSASSNMMPSSSPASSNMRSMPSSSLQMSTLPVPSFSTTPPSSLSGSGLSNPLNSTIAGANSTIVGANSTIAGANSTKPVPMNSSMPNSNVYDKWIPSDSDWSSNWPLPSNQTTTGSPSDGSNPSSIPIRNDDMFGLDDGLNRSNSKTSDIVSSLANDEVKHSIPIYQKLSDANPKNGLTISDLVSSLMDKEQLPSSQTKNQTDLPSKGPISNMMKQMIDQSSPDSAQGASATTSSGISNGDNNLSSDNGNGSGNDISNSSGNDISISSGNNNSDNSNIDQGLGQPSSNNSISSLITWLEDDSNANKPIQSGSKRTMSDLVRWLMDEPNTTYSQADQSVGDNQSGNSGSGGNLPNTNGGNFPNTNGSNLPNTNGGNLPNTNGGNLPNTNGSNLPNTNGSNLPNTNGGNLPNMNGGNLSNTNGGNGASYGQRDDVLASSPTYRPRPDTDGSQQGANSDTSSPRGSISDLLRSLK